MGKHPTSAIGSTHRRRPLVLHEPGFPTRSTATPMSAPNRAGSAMNRPTASQVGSSNLKSTPSAWISIEPTTTPEPAATVILRNQSGPSSHGATAR